MNTTTATTTDSVTIAVTKDLRDDDIPALPDPRDHVYEEFGQPTLPRLAVELRPGNRTVSVYSDVTDQRHMGRWVNETNRVRLVWRLPHWPTTDCLRSAILDIVRDHAPSVCDGFSVEWDDRGDPVGIYSDMAEIHLDFITSILDIACTGEEEGWEIVRAADLTAELAEVA